MSNPNLYQEEQQEQQEQNFEEQQEEYPECLACCCPIEPDVYSLFRYHQDQEWIPSRYCWDCIQYLLQTKWQDYCDGISKADCAVALDRLIENGPPINLRDPVGFYDPDPEKHQEIQSGMFRNKDTSLEVFEFKFQDNVLSAKLDGSLIGQARLDWWEELKEIRRGLADREANHQEPNREDNDD